MYTQQDWKDIQTMVKKRWLLACAPAVLMLIVAIVVFVYGQLNRSDELWKLTSALTLLGGGYFLFFYGVSVRPALIYRKHLRYMLGERMRTTTGVFKAFSEDVCDHDGLECHSMLVNVGEKNDPKDDRLFYFDAYKPNPAFELGERITVISNDKMVADVKPA